MDGYSYPIFPEFLLCILGIVEIHRAVDLLQVCADCLPVFVLYKFRGIPDLMDDAKLLLCLGEDRIDGFAKPFQVVMTGDEDVLHTTLFQVGADRRIKLAPSFSLIQMPRMSFRPSISMPSTE